MEDVRETKFSNQILFNLFKDYNVSDIKILSILVNRLVTKFKAIENDNGQIDESFLTLGISKDFFNKYKGSKNLTIRDIENVIESISRMGIRIFENDTHIKINIIDKYKYDKSNGSFQVVFNNSAIEYLVLINEKFTLLDLNIIKDINSKHKLGLYILIEMYSSTGICIRKIEDLKEYFNSFGSTNDLMKYLRAARDDLNKKYKYNIRFEKECSGRTIKIIKIKFKTNTKTELVS